MSDTTNYHKTEEFSSFVKQCVEKLSRSESFMGLQQQALEKVCLRMLYCAKSFDVIQLVEDLLAEYEEYQKHDAADTAGAATTGNVVDAVDAADTDNDSFESKEESFEDNEIIVISDDEADEVDGDALITKDGFLGILSKLDKLADQNKLTTFCVKIEIRFMKEFPLKAKLNMDDRRMEALSDWTTNNDQEGPFNSYLNLSSSRLVLTTDERCIALYSLHMFGQSLNEATKACSTAEEKLAASFDFTMKALSNVLV
ncbi:unnamed protein product [Mucor circinelloides]